MKIPVGIRRMVLTRSANKADIKKLEASATECDKHIIGFLEKFDDEADKTIVVDDVQLTLVQPTSDYLDTDKLKELIGDAAYQSLTTVTRQRVFDEDKLKKAVKNGTITEAILKQSMTREKRKSYLKQTILKPKD